MPKSKSNPLSGLSESQIKALVESADVSDTDSVDEEDGPVEIIIRGKNAESILEKLGFTQGKNYDPTESDEPDGGLLDDGKEEKKEKTKGQSLADKLFAIKP